jgi:hypothetical protein
VAGFQEGVGRDAVGCESFLAAFQKLLVVAVLLKRILQPEPGWVVGLDLDASGDGAKFDLLTDLLMKSVRKGIAPLPFGFAFFPTKVPAARIRWELQLPSLIYDQLAANRTLGCCVGSAENSLPVDL